MNIHEYQAKEILRRYGIPIPRGEVARAPAEARAIAERYGGPVMVKAQVLTGGRGKAGGVKYAATPADAERLAGQILGMDIKGHTVEQVLITEAADIKHEIYLGIVHDRANQGLTLMASAEGGIDIEEVAATAPEKIIMVTADPELGLLRFQAQAVAFGLGLPNNLVPEFVEMANRLFRAVIENDATLAEINPLIVNGQGHLESLDAKIDLDDNALYRHKDFELLRDVAAEDPYERMAREAGISFVKLQGEVGCMVNGAGLAMATMDIVKLAGGNPSNFLDVGGGGGADKVAAALNIILADPTVKSVLVNIFGGISRCDEVALGIVQAKQHLTRQVPMVVRLRGTNEAEGRRILADANVIAAQTLEEAARLAVEEARR